MTFALQFDFPDGQEAVRKALQGLLPGSEQIRGALVYRDTVLKFEKTPLHGEDGEYDLQISAFPLLESDLAHQQAVFKEVLGALQALAGDVDILAEDELR